jgi:hypothetical protein
MAFHLLSVSGLITDTVSNGHMQDTMGKPASGMSVFSPPVGMIFTASGPLQFVLRRPTGSTPENIPPATGIPMKGTTGSRSGAPPSSRPARRRRGLRGCHTLSRVNTV